MPYSCLNWGYNDNLNVKYRKDEHDRWFYNYNKVKRIPLTWKEECLKTAKLINETYNIPINILVSGGVDSLVCCESFRLSNVPFTAVIFNFKYNTHDIKYAIDYCKNYEVKYKIIDIDIIDFFENKLLKYSEYTQCRNPQIVFQAYMTEFIEGLPVFGLGELFLCLGQIPNSKFKGCEQAPVNDGKVLTFEGEQYQAIERLLRYRNRPGVPKFFIYTSELKLSLLINPIILEWIKNAKANKQQDTDYFDPRLNSNFKSIFYLHYFPEVGTRPAISYKRFKGLPKIISRNDYTGFEYISDRHRVYQDELFKKFPEEYNQFSWIPYIDKIKSLCSNSELIENVYEQIKEH